MDFGAALALFGVGGSMGFTVSCHLSSSGGGFSVSSETGYFYFGIWLHGHFFIQVFGKPLKQQLARAICFLVISCCKSIFVGKSLTLRPYCFLKQSPSCSLSVSEMQRSKDNTVDSNT